MSTANVIEIKIKKQVEEVIKVGLPAYRKMNKIFYCIETPENFLKVINDAFHKQLEVVTGLPVSTASTLDNELSTEAEFEANKNDVLAHIQNAFMSVVPAEIFDRNETISNSLNTLL